MWTGCLRYIFTLPLMGAIALVSKPAGKRTGPAADISGPAAGQRTGSLSSSHTQPDYGRDTEGCSQAGNALVNTLLIIKDNPVKWLIWSTVGFGLFYAPLTLAAVYGESWFTAATWQITIVCGVILTPLFGRSIPLKNLLCSAFILVGILLLQTTHFGSMDMRNTLVSLFFIIIGAVSYPLGNRKMMSICPEGTSTVERVFGMTLCSMPFWLILTAVALVTDGLPSVNQIISSFIIALFAGVIATLFFFEATNLVRSNPRQLAVIEATQSGEVIFTFIGGVLFLGDPLPTVTGFIGLAIIIMGMTANSLISGE